MSRALSVADAIDARRSARSFSDEAISEDLLHELLRLTVAAPSSYNLQPWRIVAVKDATARAELAKASYGQKQVAEAAVVLVFAASLGSWSNELSDMLEQGNQAGAWSDQATEFFARTIPQFQESLASNGLLREFAIKDAMIAATHAALAAESLGLASCFMNGWVEAEVKKAIGAGDDPDVVIAVLLPVGYARAPAKSPGRWPLSHNVSVDRLDRSYGSD